MVDAVRVQALRKAGQTCLPALVCVFFLCLYIRAFFCACAGVRLVQSASRYSGSGTKLPGLWLTWPDHYLSHTKGGGWLCLGRSVCKQQPVFRSVQVGYSCWSVRAFFNFLPLVNIFWAFLMWYYSFSVRGVRGVLVLSDSLLPHRQWFLNFLLFKFRAQHVPESSASE